MAEPRNNSDAMLADVARRLFADAADDASLWDQIEALGLTLAVAPEPSGGSGLRMSDILPLLQSFGRNAIALPLPETLIAARLLGLAGLPIPPGKLTAVSGGKLTRLGSGGWRLAAGFSRIAWASEAACIAVIAETDEGLHVAAVDLAGCVMTRAANLAGEPRDSGEIVLELEDRQIGRLPGVASEMLLCLGAAMRTAQIAGALAGVLDLCTGYAQQRVQFGKKLAQFQAIQHLLAVLAEHAAMAEAAADLAMEALDAGTLSDIAIAKAAASEAAGAGAAIAHQVHGAIGITREYPLHRLTLRLLSWRDEFGSEVFWQNRIGQAALATGGGEKLWPELAH